MDGFAVVTKCLLRESFGITGCLRPLCPGVAVAVQRDAFDAQTNTALVKFRGAVACAHGPQIRKQRPLVRQRTQKFRHVLIEPQQRNPAGLRTGKAENVVLPINILRRYGAT